MGFNVGRVEATARRLLLGSKVYAPLRFGYQFLFDRARFAHRLGMRKFYGAFVGEGDLVFDVGANVGRYSEIFADLGAKVIAVEPSPRCGEELARLAKVRAIHLETCAAGDTPGRLNLRICEDSALSTVTEEWYKEASRSEAHKGTQWLESLEVDVVTLDQLAERYGIPAFVKIDAEGYDDHVLRGMSFQPRALSFEYNRYLPKVAARCLETPVLSSGYEFNFSRGLEMELISENWMGGEELRENFTDFVGSEEYGDVFARSTALSD